MKKQQFLSAIGKFLTAVCILALLAPVPAAAAPRLSVPRRPDIGKVIAKAQCTLYLRPDGTVTASNLDFAEKLSAWRDVVDVDVSYWDAAALTERGTVYTTIEGSAAGRWKNIVGISLSTNGLHLMGLQADGNVLIEGNYDFSTANLSAWKNIVSVSAGGNHCVGLRADGTVLAAGDNSHGQCNVAGWRNITAVFAEDTYTLGLRSNGTLVYAGTTPEGWERRNASLKNVTAWKGIVSVDTGPVGIFAIREDGTMVCCPAPEHYGHFEDYDYYAGEWTDLAQVSAFYQVAGLKKDGSMICFGGPLCAEGDPCRLTQNTMQHMWGYVKDNAEAQTISRLTCFLCGASVEIPPYDANASKHCSHKLVRIHADSSGNYRRYYACTLCGLRGIYGPTQLTQLPKLADTNDISGVDIQVGDWTDVSGELHAQSLKFWVMDRPGYERTESIEYSLEGKYNCIKATIYMCDMSDAGAEASVCIYADGVQILRDCEITMENPVNSGPSLDITGVQTLRVECTGTTSASAYCIVAAKLY